MLIPLEYNSTKLTLFIIGSNVIFNRDKLRYRDGLNNERACVLSFNEIIAIIVDIRYGELSVIETDFKKLLTVICVFCVDSLLIITPLQT